MDERPEDGVHTEHDAGTARSPGSDIADQPYFTVNPASTGSVTPVT